MSTSRANMGRAAVALGLITVSAASAANRANDYLLSVDPPTQATTLAGSVGENCKGKTAFYMGIGKSGFSKDKAFWSLRCADGREFMVQVNPDGTSNVMECAILKAVNAGTCFEKFKN